MKWRIRFTSHMAEVVYLDPKAGYLYPTKEAAERAVDKLERTNNPAWKGTFKAIPEGDVR